MTMAPSIAVVVPNRNDARYLPRCLRSVLDQKVRPDELIVVDDQSTDGSVQAIKTEIVGRHEAQLIVNPVNLGTNGALNEGLKRTQCDYVLFLASNDMVLPGIFARARQGLSQSPQAGLWSALSQLMDEEDRPIRLHPSPIVALKDVFLSPERCVKLAYRFGNWFTGSTLIYHRETLHEVGGFDAAYGAPADLFTALTVASLRGAAYTPEPYAAIRIHAGSYSSQALNDMAGLDAMLARLQERGPRLSPKLFSGGFLARTASRFYFAAIRASRGRLVLEAAERETDWKRRALLTVHRVVPESFWRLRTVLAFVILRSFDILPTLWNRALGWTFVRMRMLLVGGREGSSR